MVGHFKNKLAGLRKIAVCRPRMGFPAQDGGLLMKIAVCQPKWRLNDQDGCL